MHSKTNTPTFYYWQGNKAAEIEANEGKAFGLWYQAAELGNIEACYTVGFHYSRGIKEPDEIKYATADQKYFGLEDRVIAGREYIHKDDKKAVKWFKKAMDSGHQLAKFCLADHYYSGSGVLKDPIEAISLYQSIVENNNATDDLRTVSAFKLGQIFEDRSARLMENYYYTIAAEGGIAEAMYKVGVIAYEDYPDKGKSAYWIGKAYNDHNYEKAKIFWDAKELWRFGGWAP